MTNLKSVLIQNWQKRWLRRSAISLFLVIFILIVTPFIIQYSITNLIVNKGAKNAEIDDINLNLFEGTFELKGLVITTKSDEQILLSYLYADINMLDLFSSKIVADKIEVNGIKTHVHRDDEGVITIHGLLLPTAAEKIEETKTNSESVEPIKFGVNFLSLKDINVVYSEPGFSQHKNIESIELNNLKSWDQDSNSQLKLTMQVNQAPIDIDVDLKIFHPRKQIKGNFSISTLDLSRYEKFYRSYLGHLNGHLSLKSNFDISLEEDNEQFKISAQTDNTLLVSNLDFSYQELVHTTKQISWKGKTGYQQDGSLDISGNLEIAESKTIDAQLGYLIMSLDSLKLNDLHTDINESTFSQLTLNNIKAVMPDKSAEFIQLVQIGVNEFQFNQKDAFLNIQSVHLAQPEVRLTLNKDKQIKQLAPLLKTVDRLTATAQAESNNSENTKAGNQKEESNAIAISVGSFELSKPGKINFEDTSISPNYKTNFELQKLLIKPISSTQPAQFNAVIKQGGYTLYDINGTGQLFDPANRLNLEAKVKQLDLPPVTSYTSDAIGYGMKSGVLDSDIKLSLTKRQIDATLKLKLDSIEVVETNSKTAEQLSSASGMSIDLALSTLKDSNNMIELEIPISGNIDEPDFDLSLIINKAMGTAMQSASLSYLKHALQPFGSLLTLYELAKAASNHISLAPVLFAANSLEFKEQQQDLLEKVTKVLQERPNIKIKTCAISADQDQVAIKQQFIDEETSRLKQKFEKDKSKDAQEKLKTALYPIVIDDKVIAQKMLDLANQRSAKVKAYFVDTSKIEPNRILNCLSSIKTEEDQLPSVELQI